VREIVGLLPECVIGARRTALLAERTIMNAGNSAAKIRVGILGVGNWARYGHIPALRLLPQYEIVAVSFDDASKLVNHPMWI